MSILILKIKNFLIEKRGWIVLVIFLAGLVLFSFGIGYVIGKQWQCEPVIIYKHN